MPRFFVKSEQIKDNEITIIGEDVKHIKICLIRIIDRYDNFRETKITEYLESPRNPTEAPGRVRWTSPK